MHCVVLSELVNTNSIESCSSFVIGSSLDRILASTKFVQSPASNGLLSKGYYLSPFEGNMRHI